MNEIKHVFFKVDMYVIGSFHTFYLSNFYLQKNIFVKFLLRLSFYYLRDILDWELSIIDDPIK
jgi:hypothetical protein